MIVLYTMSSIYHGLSAALMGKRVLQVMDHCSVFLLIAGTYTPYCLCTLRQASTALGWSYFGVVWGITALGVTLNAIDLKKYAVFSNICYLALGWCIITRTVTVWRGIGGVGFLLLLSGGIAYTVGAILYMNASRCRYMHSVFHLFVLAGTILQFFSILLYVI
jgi:hemolysin III